MAEAATAQSEQPQQPQANRQPYSRPVFRQKLTVNSLQAQRVMERSFDRVSNALFSLDVILRIIGDQTEINQVEEIVQGHIERVAEDMAKAMEQLKKVMSDNGIEAVPGYSAPTEYSIEITSPQIAQIARLIRNLDELMSLVDTLWLNSILSSQQRSDATYEWQQRLIKLAGRIIGMEKRARISAHSKGKDKEVAEAAPEQETTDPELSSEADVQDNEDGAKSSKKGSKESSSGAEAA
ncbi:hypothetical protein [Marinobacterium aestuariivivens]|uniref:DUF1845 domain-containing protein n=1 Tax=Marinobacterium aestuariivivens TaxID=1698799 RepID=A0ABW2A9Z5_9GAMM